MSEPWSTAPLRRLAACLLDSHRHWTGEDLVDPSLADPAHALYHSGNVVLAHDGAEDPCFIYANLAAQRLWERPWPSFIGLPSRLSAEPDQLEQRQLLLERTRAQGVADGYRGVRISASGRRFSIEDARLWNLIDAQGRRFGQAAHFCRWRML